MNLTKALIFSATIAMTTVSFANETKAKREPNQVSTNYGKSIANQEGCIDSILELQNLLTNSAKKRSDAFSILSSAIELGDQKLVDAARIVNETLASESSTAQKAAKIKVSNVCAQTDVCDQAVVDFQNTTNSLSRKHHNAFLALASATEVNDKKLVDAANATMLKVTGEISTQKKASYLKATEACLYVK